MSSGQFLVIFFVGAAIAFGGGVLLGRRVRLVEDWQRLLAIGAVCVAIGGGVAATDATLTAEFLIALALAWFGVLLCGFAGVQNLRPREEPAPPPRVEPELPRVEPVDAPAKTTPEEPQV